MDLCNTTLFEVSDTSLPKNCTVFLDRIENKYGIQLTRGIEDEIIIAELKNYFIVSLLEHISDITKDRMLSFYLYPLTMYWDFDLKICINFILLHSQKGQFLDEYDLFKQLGPAMENFGVVFPNDKIFEELKVGSLSLVEYFRMKKVPYSLEKFLKNDQIIGIHQYLQSVTIDPQEKSIAEDGINFMFLIGLYIQEIQRILEKNGLLTQIQENDGVFLEEIQQTVIYEIQDEINANSIPKILGLTLELAGIARKLHLNSCLYHTYGIMHLYGEKDYRKAIRIKNSQLYEKYGSNITNSTFGLLLSKNCELFIKKSKIPYEEVFLFLLEQQENDSFIETVDRLFESMKRLSFQFPSPDLLNILKRLLTDVSYYQSIHFETIALLLKNQIPLETILNLDRDHLSNIFFSQATKKQILQALVNDRKYLENTLKLEIQQKTSSLSLTDEAQQALQEILQSDESYEVLQANYMKFQILYTPSEIPVAQKHQTIAKNEQKIGKTQTLDVWDYINHYYGKEGSELLRHHIEKTYIEEKMTILEKIREIGEKTPSRFRDDFLLEFVSDSISETSIDFYLACIHALKYYNIKILDLVDMDEMLIKSTPVLKTVTTRLNHLQFPALRQPLDLKLRVEKILENPESFQSPVHEKIDLEGAKNIHDQSILEVLKSNDSEKMQLFVKNIGLLLDNILTQFHPSLTTTTQHGSFGKSSGHMTQTIKSHLISKLKKKKDEKDKVYLKRLTHLSFQNYLGNISQKDIKGQSDLGVLVHACQTETNTMMLFEYLQTLEKVISNIQLFNQKRIDLGPLAEYFVEILENEMEKLGISEC